MSRSYIIHTVKYTSKYICLCLFEINIGAYVCACMCRSCESRKSIALVVSYFIMLPGARDDEMFRVEKTKRQGSGL